MGLCWWVVKVEFWYFFDAEKTEVVVWPVCEVEPVLVLAVFVVLCVFEEWVLGGAVVWYEICDDVEVVCVCFVYEFFEVFDGSEMRIDLVEIGDVISVVRGGLVKRGYPECCDSKVGDIGEFVDDSTDGSPYEVGLVPVCCFGESCEPVDEEMVNSAFFKPGGGVH